MEEDDDEDRERGKHPSNGHNTNNANRGGGSSATGIDSNRQQPKNKPKNYDGIPKNNVGNAEDEDEDDDDDDDIEFTPGGTAPKPENKIPTASSAPPADSTQQSLSPNKALTSYLVPIVVMWLGNMF
jgi:hypothetical protein